MGEMLAACVHITTASNWAAIPAGTMYCCLVPLRTTARKQRPEHLMPPPSGRSPNAIQVAGVSFTKGENFQPNVLLNLY